MAEPAPPVAGIDNEVPEPGGVEAAPEDVLGELPAAVPEEAPTPAEMTGSPVTPPPPPDVYIIVRPGDSLWSVSRELWGQGTRYPHLMEANDLTSDLIRPGQWLRVPDEADLVWRR